MTTCAHIARCFVERASRGRPGDSSARDVNDGEGKEFSEDVRRIDDMRAGEDRRDDKREIAKGTMQNVKWLLKNLGEALWYYKTVVAGALEHNAFESGHDVPAALVATSYNNMACIRLRVACIIHSACCNGSESGGMGADPAGEERQELMLRLRKWRRGWTWRRRWTQQMEEDGVRERCPSAQDHGASIFGRVSHDMHGVQDAWFDGDSTDSGGNECLSGESEDNSVGMGVNLDDVDGALGNVDADSTEEWHKDREEDDRVPILGHDDPWEVREAQRAVELFEEAADLFKQNRCQIEASRALRNRDLAKASALELDEHGENVMYACQTEELPLPHVMACFDARRRATPNDLRPILLEYTPASGQNHSLSWEQEMFLSHGGSAGTDSLNQPAVNSGQDIEQLMSQLSFRKSVMRDNWRLAHLSGMLSRRDADARYWALRQLDQLLMRLEILLCDNELRRQRHTAYATILAADRQARVRISEVAQVSSPACLCAFPV